MRIRTATELDLPTIGEIYNDVVRTTFAIFQDEPLAADRLRSWFIGRVGSGYPFYVAEDDVGSVVGYASFGPFRAASGYAFTVENAVHVAADRRGHGIGSRLLAALLEEAQRRHLHAMVAGIDAENVGSIELHRKFGFEIVGRLPQIARKRGEWRSLLFMQRLL